MLVDWPMDEYVEYFTEMILEIIVYCLSFENLFFADIKLSEELRPELYKLMIETLNPEEDLGVRLAASNALKQAIDDFQFNSEKFSPFLEPVFSLLFALLKEVNECDTKVREK